MSCQNFTPSAYLAIAQGFMSHWVHPAIRATNTGPMPKSNHLPKRGKYKPHQGNREKARRLRQGLTK